MSTGVVLTQDGQSSTSSAIPVAGTSTSITPISGPETERLAVTEAAEMRAAVVRLEDSLQDSQRRQQQQRQQQQTEDEAVAEAAGVPAEAVAPAGRPDPQPERQQAGNPAVPENRDYLDELYEFLR